jgi:hypothetical protein
MVSLSAKCHHTKGFSVHFLEDGYGIRGSGQPDLISPRARVREAIKACPTPRKQSDIAPGLDRAPAQPLRHGHWQAREANGWTRDLSGAVRSRVRESLVREGT